MYTALAILFATGVSAASPLTTLGTDGLQADEVAAPLELDAGDQASAQVWNGTRVGANGLRSVVALFVGRQGGGGGWSGHTFCSGTLIHPEWVVTAAHCLNDVTDQTGGGYNLYVGVGSEFPFDKQVAWSEYAIHPDYNPNAPPDSGSDIGLVKLASPIFGEPLMPVIRQEMDGAWVGQMLTLAGFGITVDEAGDSGTKRRTDLPLIHFAGDLLMSFNGDVYYDQRDGAYYPARYNSTSNVCQGDSGGATLVATDNGGFALVGVNAIVTPGCANGAAGSTRVDWFVDWIGGFVPLDEVLVPDETGPEAPEYTLDAFEPGKLEPLPYSDPLTPSEALAYDQVTSCSQSGGQVGWMWLAAFAALGWRRRER